ncbi:unnamed protein product [Notodromas monacha]|uniref:Exostosin GT47 domain-containing protein n=1 Tax=Notodromas monacha TaxID=399045 RepID=A0A7R9BHI1_9CRUS|nr:unnamed protein product [Notodromas monacha]CAG0914222.1 unnamed protein product [Notodromas monacha]
MESRRQTNSGFRQFLCSLKLQHLFVFTLAAVLLVALVMHWALNTVGLGLNIVEGDGGEDEVRARHFDLLAVKLEDPDYLVATDLRTRLLDMLSIRSSVKNELNDLEARRTSLRKQIADNQEDLDRLKASVSRIRAELARLQLSTQQAESRYRETVEKRMIPKLSLPAKLSMSTDPLRLPEFRDKQNSPCTVDTCFDFSRCSIASPHLTLDLSVLTAVGDTKQSRRAWLKRLINDPTSVLPGLAIRRSSGSESQHEPPCLRLVVADNATQSGACRGPDGVNCLLLLLDNGSWRPDESMMIVSSGFPRGTFRPGFDIAIPHLDHAESRAVVTNDDEEWEELPPAFSPARRKYLASFQGEWSKKTHGVADDDAMATFLRQQLDAMAADSVETDKFFLQWECGERLLTTGASFLPPSWNDSIGAWQVCSGDQARRRILEESTFCFVLPSQQAQVHVRLVECLRAGAVPVLLWSRDIDEGWLPLDEVIDWRRCVVRVAPARLPELHFVLRSLGDADVLAMRRQGWHVWRNYFSSPARVLRAVVGLMRHRLLLPPPPAPDVAYTPMHDPVKNPMLTFEPPRGETEEEQEMLGPAHEPPTPSVTFTRNVSQLLLDSSAIWNDWFQPHWTFSARPSDPWLLSEALFRGSGAGFRPLGGGQGGAGKEMSEALGGNLPHEQFTILILTYQREQVLLSALSRFVGLPYLNKVIGVSKTCSGSSGGARGGYDPSS